MKFDLPPAHRVARNNYAPRTAAFAFSFLTIGTLQIERGEFTAWAFVAACATFLLYPHLAYLHARIAVLSKRAELNNLYADALLLGLWVAQIDFALWPSVGLLIAVCLNSAGHGYFKRLILSVTIFGIAAAAWGAATGYGFKPETGPLVTGLSIAGLLAYVSWVGALVFLQNKNLVRARNNLRASEEQFRFIAENMGEMVSVLDIEGRFQYTSSLHSKRFVPETVAPGASWLLHVHPDDRDYAKSFLHTILTSAANHRIQLRLAYAKGLWCFMECQGNPVLDDSGKPQSIVLVAQRLVPVLEPEAGNPATPKSMGENDWASLST
jgi:PAS domain S-box-containing protein